MTALCCCSSAFNAVIVSLRPPHTNCDTPQTRVEIHGVRYAVGIADDVDPDHIQQCPKEEKRQIDSDVTPAEHGMEDVADVALVPQAEARHTGHRSNGFVTGEAAADSLRTAPLEFVSKDADGHSDFNLRNIGPRRPATPLNMLPTDSTRDYECGGLQGPMVSGDRGRGKIEGLRAPKLSVSDI